MAILETARLRGDRVNLLLFISAVIFLDVAIFNWFLAYVTQRNIQLGVRIPRDRETDPAIGKVRREFHKTLLAGSLAIFLLTYAIPVFLGYQDITVISMTLEIVFTHFNYYLAFRKLHRLKVDQGWYDGANESIGAVYPEYGMIRKVVRSSYFIFPAVALLAAAIFIGVSGYPHFPPYIPGRFSMNGVPTQYIPKTYYNIFSITILQAAFTLIFFFIGYAIIKTRQEIDVSRPYTTYEQQTRFKEYYRDAIYSFCSLLGITFFLISVRKWEYPALQIASYFYILPLILAYILIISTPITMGQLGSRLKIAGDGKENTGTSNQDDDRNWKVGMFYYNPRDPALVVARRFGIGWTLNFGNPISWFISGGAFLLFVFLITRYLH